jgi:ribonuclease HI/ADP-ribose pyrophosphatase YjhB (NUDIX family)
MINYGQRNDSSIGKYIVSMKQRIVVQAIIRDGDKILLLRRSQGRPVIVGKYELPGGTLDYDEQPDDALRRHIKGETGLSVGAVRPQDIVSMVNREEGDIQHILISYAVTGVTTDVPISLGHSYDRHEWKQLSEIQQDDLRDSAQLLLGLYDQTKMMVSMALGSPSAITEKADELPYIYVYSDGGSRGNPGPSAAAFVVMDGQEGILDQGGVYLGITTNNQAEYHGVQLGLERALELGIKTLEFRLDSLLVVNQLKGIYKIKNRELWPINERIRILIDKFDKVIFTHVPREQNQQADLLVNKLLDEHQKDLAVV